jgi:hypothetical protein
LREHAVRQRTRTIAKERFSTVYGWVLPSE